MIVSKENKIQLNTIEEAIDDIRNGKVIIVVDDENRENEGRFYRSRRKGNPGDDQFYGTAWSWPYLYAT